MTVQHTAERKRSLLIRHRNFRLLWSGETASFMGTAMSGVVLPLIAITVLDSGTFVIAMIEAALWVPWLVLGLPAGAIVDRVRSRPLMIACDIVGAAAFLTVPMAALFDALTVAHLLAVALISGTRAVFFDPAYYKYVPHLVDAEDLPPANSLLHGSESAALVAGPSIAGVLASVVGAVFGLLLDALSFLVSALCLARIDAREPDPQHGTGEGLLRQINEGLRTVRHDPYIRVFALLGGLQNFTFTAVGALQIVFLIRVNGLSSGTAGILVGFAGVGGILSAAMASRLIQSLGSARTVLLGTATSVLLGLLVPLTRPGVAVGFYVIGTVVPTAAVVVCNIVMASFLQTYCPREVLGRVITTARVVAYAAAPVGAVLAGALGTAMGIRSALWVLSLFALSALVVLLASPIPYRRDLPTAAGSHADPR